MTPTLIKIKSHTQIACINVPTKFEQDILINVEIPRVHAHTQNAETTKKRFCKLLINPNDEVL